MTLNTFCLMVAVGLEVRLSLADKELDLIDNTVAVRPTHFSPVLHWPRVLAHGAHASVETLESKGAFAPRGN